MNEAKLFPIKHKAHRIKPLLQLESPFTVRDMQKLDVHEEMSPQNWIRFLYSNDAIQKRDKIYVDHGDYIIKWAWDQEIKTYIKDQATRDDGLPCGCRSHIPAEIGPETKIAECKHCGAKHSKETFKEAL